MDVLDYDFYMTEQYLTLTFKCNDGKYKVIKTDSANCGLQFETYLMDKQQHCKNKCIFCFIDQLPRGLRESLYFKDDDSRLSFLFGNYITLTNISEHEVERIIKMHISPVNISVHTMNPELRVHMMKNKNAGESLGILHRLAENGIAINTQLVLCPGINDGEELRYSLDELEKLCPSLQSIACVPVGVTKHRDGLFDMPEYTKEILSRLRPRTVPRCLTALPRFRMNVSKSTEDLSFTAPMNFISNRAELSPTESTTKPTVRLKTA